MSSAGQKRSPPNELERQDSPFHGEEGKRQRSSQITNIVTYRLLCPGARTGSIIGKGGEIIKDLRHETGTKIKIEDPTPDCEDRVVTIIGPDRAATDLEDNPAQTAVLRVFDRVIDASNPGLDAGQVFMGRMLLRPPQVGSVLGKGGQTIAQIRRETGCSIRVLQPGDVPPSAMHADPFAQVVQVTGSLQAVQNGLAAICSQLRINPGKAWSEPHSAHGRLPPVHAAPTRFNSQAPPFRPSGPSRPQGPHRRGPYQDSYHQHGPYQPPPPPRQAPRMMRESQPELQHMPGEPDIEIGYRLLIPVTYVGALIGRGGEAIAQLRQRTRARVKVHDAHDASEQRVVSISGREEAEAPMSPAIQALMYCAAPVLQEEGEPQKVLRLVVPSSQVGCVLGKKGSIVSMVRGSTGAMVRVLEQNKGQRRLESGEEVDEVIEIQGPAQSCDSALQAVSELLRQYQIKITLRQRHADQMSARPPHPHSPAYGGPAAYSPAYPSGQVPYGAAGPAPPYADPTGYNPSYPPSEMGAAPPQTALAGYPSPSYGQQPGHFPSQTALPGYQSPSYGQPPGSLSPGQQPLQQGAHQGIPGGYQAVYEAPANLTQYAGSYDMGDAQYSGSYDAGLASQSSLPYDAAAAPRSPFLDPYAVAHPPLPGYGQGIPGVSPIIQEPDGSSRVHLTVVGPQVGAVLGRNGTNISQIRQISGAKVKLHEAPKGAPHTAASQAGLERQLDITGASGQVQAAMKLVQAFLLAGSVEPLNIPDF